MKNTAIFVDYDNVFITLETYYEKQACMKVQESILPLMVDLYKSDNVLLTRAYFDFSNIKISKQGFENFQNYLIDLIHVYSGTNTSDINLIIDVFKSIHVEKLNVDKFVIVSSDSDLFPIIKELRALGKEIELYYFEYNTNSNYIKLLENLGVKNQSIESILAFTKYEERNDAQFHDTDNLRNIAIGLDQIIYSIYNKFLKRKDRDGAIISAGTVNKGNLMDNLLLNKLFVRRDIDMGYAIDYMIANSLIYEYIPPLKKHSTFLLRKEYFEDQGIEITPQITEKSFDF